MLFLVLPDACGVVFGLANEGAVCWIQVNAGDAVGVADEGAKDVVVVQGPVHNSVVVISLAGCQYALVVVSKFDQVDSVALAEVCVDFVSAFEVVK